MCEGKENVRVPYYGTIGLRSAVPSTPSLGPKGLNRRPTNTLSIMGVNHEAVEDMARDVDENEELYDALAVNYDDVEDGE